MDNTRAGGAFEHADAASGEVRARAGQWVASMRPYAPMLVAIACMLALCGAFLWVFLTSPSDGTRIDPGEAAWQHNGVVVLPLVLRPDGLRPGDLVVAIDGRSLASWSSNLFHPGTATPRLSFGQRTVYAVVRGKQHLDVVVRLGAYPLGAMASKSWGMLVFVTVYGLIGLFVFMRRPSEASAVVLFFGSACLLGASAWLFGPQVISLASASEFWLYSVSVLAVYLLFWSSQLHFSLVFPSPTRLTRTRPWIIPLIYALPFAVYAVYLGVTRILTPSTLAWIGLWEPGEVSIGTVYVALAVVIMTVTYRTHTDPATQRKIRWVVFAGAISGGGAIVLWIVPWDVFGHPVISTNLLGLLLLPFPVALAIAILRYRLFDIDVIIRRTLIYSLVTGTLAAIYAVSGLFLQAAFSGLTGQGSALAIVGSTLAIVALFQPVRSRIQAVVDRRFYRGKYDAERTLEAFGATLHAELDLAQLSQRLVAVVEETMHPTSVSLWLRVREATPGLQDTRLWKQAARLSSPPSPSAGSSAGTAQRSPPERGMVGATAGALVGASAGERTAATRGDETGAGQLVMADAPRESEEPT